MTDGYDGYNAVVATPGVERLACWAHVCAAGLLRPYAGAAQGQTRQSR
jgi:hypothetical protein